MQKPVLVVMAAGMGSRYGGMKQIDPVGANGELIIDYSIFDARRAGFDTVIFIIKQEIEELFKNAIGDRLSKYINVKYAYQELDKLPEGYNVPQERVKPWGTAHAVLCAQQLISGPFAVINADDYYGVQAFSEIYNYLCATPDKADMYEYTMVGYELQNTVTDNGHVARGICVADNDGYLSDITERTRIEKYTGGIHYTQDDGASWVDLEANTIVSMNMWGFTNSFLTEAKARFGKFLDTALQQNPLKCEYFLPTVVDSLLKEGKARVKVLTSPDKWYGVTYKEDKPVVVAAIKEMTQSGKYPQNLWQ